MSIDEKVITPCYLINLEQVTQNYHEFFSLIHISGRQDILAYSVKANYDISIIKELDRLGAYFEVCSKYEYNLLLTYGINPVKIIINACSGTGDVFDWGHRSFLIILDSPEQVHIWVNNGCVNEIGLRVNLNCLTQDDRFQNKVSRFGLDLQSTIFKNLLKKVDRSKIVCLHCHLSGNNREPSIYADAISEIYSYIKEFRFTSVRNIDIGGGFKIGDNYWKFSDYIDAIDQACKVRGNDIPIIYELGNSLVINVAEYHTRIISHKEINGSNIFIVDGSSLHLPKIAIKNLKPSIKNIHAQGESYDCSVIAGNTCKEADVLATFKIPITVAIGDEIVCYNIGAYSLNTLNTLILGMPKIYVKENEKIFMRIGKYNFLIVCRYMDCFIPQDNANNDYSIIDEKLNGEFKGLPGLYSFVNDSGEIIYIGEAHQRPLSTRIKQHFRVNDTGGLRYKLSQEEIVELEHSTLCVCPLNLGKDDIRRIERELIVTYHPPFNFV